MLLDGVTRCNSVAGWLLDGVTVLLDAKHLHLQNVTRPKFFKIMLEIAKYSGTISLYRCSTRCSSTACSPSVKLGLAVIARLIPRVMAKCKTLKINNVIKHLHHVTHLTELYN